MPHLPTGSIPLLGFQPKVKAIALIPTAVTPRTTACCSTQVVDITLTEHRSANITSLRVVQQKHCRTTHTYNITNFKSLQKMIKQVIIAN